MDMNLRRLLLRSLKRGGVSFVALVILLALVVQANQWLLRWRAERLMADMHRIRLYQTTWADAQQLMHRWGKWGHYDGTCTSQDCRYRIEFGSLFDIGTTNVDRPLNRLWLRTLGSGIFGTRLGAFSASFVVHDGTIWRTEAEMEVQVPPRRFESDDESYLLIVKTKSRSSLHRSKTDQWILGDDDQLAEHPFYKVGRPGGCENCFAAVVTYSTHTPQEKIAQLTDFNFSCFTRLHPCRWLGDVLPMAWQWRLYSRFEPGHTLAMDMPEPPLPCDVPIWALSRDSHHVLAITATSSNTEKSLEGPVGWEHVRIDAILKGDSQFQPGTKLSLFSPHDYAETAEGMTPGRNYLIFFDDFGQDASSGKPAPSVRLERCGALPDTPEARAEIAKGMAMNDNLRGPERW